jgi:transmembrane sensor
MQKDSVWELIAKKLAGEATLSELKELEDRLRQDPDMHYPLQTVSDLWHHKAKQEEDGYEAFDRHANRMRDLGIEFNDTITAQEDSTDVLFEQDQNAGKKHRKWFVFSTLALLAIIIPAYYLLSKGSEKQPTQTAIADKSEVSTKYGSKTNLVLPDGTQVWLNSGSRLTYDKNYGNTLREVVLTGEAYFDVVKNPNLPFVIHASKINIKVLGTAFNVKAYPGEKNIETSLVRGSIEVTFKDRPSEKIILKPNEKLVIANEEDAPEQIVFPTIKTTKISIQEPIVAISHLTYQPKDSTVIETSWMEGKLIFRSETFEELAIQMERWFGITIHFTDEELKKKKCTGIFENESTEQALAALQLIVPFRYSINKKEVFISK